MPRALRPRAIWVALGVATARARDALGEIGQRRIPGQRPGSRTRAASRPRNPPPGLRCGCRRNGSGQLFARQLRCNLHGGVIELRGAVQGQEFAGIAIEDEQAAKTADSTTSRGSRRANRMLRAGKQPGDQRQMQRVAAASGRHQHVPGSSAQSARRDMGPVQRAIAFASAPAASVSAPAGLAAATESGPALQQQRLFLEARQPRNGWPGSGPEGWCRRARNPAGKPAPGFAGALRRHAGMSVQERRATRCANGRPVSTPVEPVAENRLQQGVGSGIGGKRLGRCGPAHPAHRPGSSSACARACGMVAGASATWRARASAPA